MPEVMDRTGMGRSWVFQAVKDGRFPSPISVPGSRSVAWVEGEVTAWIAQSIQTSRKAS
ncbi:helix-turn-helix transcriptional regulator [Achromobacter xylosoxidans]|uniref:helix-turn-helix transcriptional regulator n=1 Tax=Alcaligenes xylosoxydans xylosoxydans TaxID=85698 RepID=UPI00211D0A8C|nr:AlpA family phage regulatory protein [Achromobacter xylosoxidans]